jgi:hypothetical protein
MMDLIPITRRKMNTNQPTNRVGHTHNEEGSTSHSQHSLVEQRKEQALQMVYPMEAAVPTHPTTT